VNDIMEYTPISPFMRPISHAHLRVVERPEASVPGKPVNKWELLRELSKAQAAFGVSERDLTVLQGLLSFFPDDALGGNAEMVVFPSNKAICERLNGMPCSTMRVTSPVWSRLACSCGAIAPTGSAMSASTAKSVWPFGFDLSPLLLPGRRGGTGRRGRA
jgi:replication initiation protein RepC